MAVYYKKLDCIFVHIYKCAGNSVRDLLSNFGVGVEILKAHSLGKDVMKYFIDKNEKDIWDNAFKFTIVRNPYEWMISLYFYIKTATGHNYHNQVKSLNFNQFIRWFADRMAEPHIYGNHRYCTFDEFIRDDNDNIIFDYICKVEYIERDMKHVLTALSAEKMFAVPKSNVRKGWTHNKDYRMYYDDDSKNMVTTLFKNELKYFGYKFE